MLSNGNSFGTSGTANGNSMNFGSGQSYGTDGSRPVSWWFTFPADPRWML